MMRTPAHLDAHAGAMIDIWQAGWGIALKRTPVGVFFRLEKDVFFRGSRGIGWWWRPTVTQAMTKLQAEATAWPMRRTDS